MPPKAADENVVLPAPRCQGKCWGSALFPGLCTFVQDPFQLFLTLLCLCLSSAGLSLLQQFEGLYSASGLTPLASHAASLGFTPTELPSAQVFLQRPTLLPLLAPLLGLSFEDCGRLLALTCFACGLCGALLLPRSAPAALGRYACLLAAWASYLSLFAILPPPFLNFQWDILLLEVAWGALLAGPVLPGAPPPGLALVVLRFAAFKLMLMSGAVKLLAGCRTWDTLTATEVHFASQPLPAPTSALLHSLPPILHRLSVAATLWIELPGALLLLLPLTARPAVVAQVLLQVLILASGNYNFFNILTLALFLPLLAGSPSTAERKWGPTLFLVLLAASFYAMFDVEIKPPTLNVPLSPAALQAAQEGWAEVHPTQQQQQQSLELLTPWWDRLHLEVRPQWRGRGEGLGPVLDFVLRFSFVHAVGMFLFEALKGLLAQVGSSALTLVGDDEEEERWGAEAAEAAGGPPDCTVRQRGYFALASEFCIKAAYSLVLMPGRIFRVLLGFVGLSLLLCASAATLVSGAVNLGTLRRPTFIDPALSKGYLPITSPQGRAQAYSSIVAEATLPPQALALHGALHPFFLSSGYGLFRTMTGQGPSGVVDAWGGAVATTLRPELIFEGWWPRSILAANFSSPSSPAARLWVEVEEEGEGEGEGEGFWRELPFPYKPGKPTVAPSWVAPHSPRLDWQLWFAALGERASDAYVLHLSSLILHGSPAVYSLLLPTHSASFSSSSSSSSSSEGSSSAGAALGWPVVVEVPRQQQGGGGGSLLYALTPKRLRIQRFAYDFVRPRGASWVRHRHQPFSAYFGDLGGDGEKGAPLASLLLPPPTSLLAGMASHPAAASLLAPLRAHLPEAPPSGPWWERAPVGGSGSGADEGGGEGEEGGEGGALFLPPVTPASKALRDVIKSAGWSNAKHAIPMAGEGGSAQPGGGGALGGEDPCYAGGGGQPQRQQPARCMPSLQCTGRACTALAPR